MRPFVSALATATLAFVFLVESAAGEPAVLIPITLTPTSVSLTSGSIKTCVPVVPPCYSYPPFGPGCGDPCSYTTYTIDGIDRAEQRGAVAEIVDNYFQVQTGPEGIASGQAEFEFAFPDDLPLGSSVLIHRSQSQPFYWCGIAQYCGGLIAKVTSTLLDATHAVPFDVLDRVDTVPGPAYPGDVVKYVVQLRGDDRQSDFFGRPNNSIRLDFRLLTTGAAAASLACKADLTGDGVVNFADLAKMKSVFFKTCAP